MLLLLALTLAAADTGHVRVQDDTKRIEDSTYLAERYRTLPFADTLRVLFGPLTIPTPLVTEDTLNGGDYDPYGDGIRLNIDVPHVDVSKPVALTGPAMELDAIYVHELVHRTQARFYAQMDLYFSRAPSVHDTHVYGYHMPREQMAQAVAQAVTWMRRYSRDTTGAGHTLDSLERHIPGTRLFALRLEHHPIYRMHPLHALPTYTSSDVVRALWSPVLPALTPGLRRFNLTLISERERVAARLAQLEATQSERYSAALGATRVTYPEIDWDVAQFSITITRLELGTTTISASARGPR